MRMDSGKFLWQIDKKSTLYKWKTHCGLFVNKNICFMYMKQILCEHLKASLLVCSLHILRISMALWLCILLQSCNNSSYLYGSFSSSVMKFSWFLRKQKTYCMCLLGKSALKQYQQLWCNQRWLFSKICSAETLTEICKGLLSQPAVLTLYKQITVNPLSIYYSWCLRYLPSNWPY